LARKTFATFWPISAQAGDTDTANIKMIMVVMMVITAIVTFAWNHTVYKQIKQKSFPFHFVLSQFNPLGITGILDFVHRRIF
jgi:hypothetical protein